MTLRWPTHRVGAYASLTVVGAVAALVLARPEPALLAAPFALHLAVGLVLADPGRGLLDVATADVRPRLVRGVEGDTIDVDVFAPAGTEVRVVLPPGLERTGPPTTDGPGAFVERVVAPRWGAYRVGRLAVRTTDPLRLFVNETPFDNRATLRIHPTAETLTRAVTAIDLQPRVGNHTSRARGDGIEFADVRPFTRGDRARAVNWRATARRGEPWVNDRRPERNADVVLLLDTFGEGRTNRLAALERAVRATAAVAATFHAQRDRIGFLTFGGQLRWIAPGLGERALLRIVDGLLDTEVLLSSSWEDVTRVPVGALPTNALLLAVTPLDNDTAVRTLLDLRARGFDVAVIALPTPVTAMAHSDLGRRFALLERDARRLRLERLGIAVGIADDSGELALALEEVEGCRRRMPRVRA